MVRSRFWQTSAALFLVFVVSAAFTRTEALRYNGLFLNLAVAITFGREAWRVSLKRRQDASDYLILGVFVSWATSGVQAAWLLLWRLGGQPSWMVNSDFNASFFAALAFAAALHLLTSNAINGEVPKGKTIIIALIVSAGLLAATLSIGMSPKVGGLLDWLRPRIQYFDRNLVGTVGALRHG